MNLTATIIFRRMTAANWVNRNPVLKDGEPGYETDTGKLKIGDGINEWNSLAYFKILAVSQGLEQDMPTATGSQIFYWATDTQKLYYDDGI